MGISRILKHYMVVSQNRGTQKQRPQNTIVLIIGTPKKVPLLLGNPYILSRAWSFGCRVSRPRVALTLSTMGAAIIIGSMICVVFCRVHARLYV